MNYFERLKKAIFLDVAFYEEVEKDKKFNDQALMTVVFVSVVQGLMIAGFAPIGLKYLNIAALNSLSFNITMLR